MPSEVQVPQSLSHLILMAVLGGTLMTIIPNLQMKKMELTERLRNLLWLFFRSLVVKGLNPGPKPMPLIQPVSSQLSSSLSSVCIMHSTVLASSFVTCFHGDGVTSRQRSFSSGRMFKIYCSYLRDVWGIFAIDM